MRMDKQNLQVSIRDTKKNFFQTPVNLNKHQDKINHFFFNKELRIYKYYHTTILN